MKLSLFLVLLMVVVFLGGCVDEKEKDEINGYQVINNISYMDFGNFTDYGLDVNQYDSIGLNSLIISFSGTANGTIIATTYLNRSKNRNHNSQILNVEFKEYLITDLKEISDTSKNFNEIILSNWYRVTDQAGIVFENNKEDNSTRERKIQVLNEIRDILKKKWYIRQVSYDIQGDKLE